MDLNIKITLSADAELLAHLAALASTAREALHGSNSQLAEAGSTPASVPVTTEPEKPKRRPAAKKTAEPVKEEVKPEDAEPVKEEASTESPKTVTLEEVRKLCIEAVQADPTKKVGLAAAMKECGGGKLSEIPPENLERLAELVKAL